MAGAAAFIDILGRKNKASLPVRYDLSRLPKVQVELPDVDGGEGYDDPDVYIDHLPPEDDFLRPLPNSKPR